MYLRIFFLLPLIICLVQCNPKSKKTEKSVAPKTSGDTRRVFYPNGKLKAEVPYKDSLRNGLSKTFDKEGRLTMELPYVNDKREGTSKRYYPNGQVATETPYVNDKISGIKRQYRENGVLMSEQPYYNDEPAIGLVEYTREGKPKEKSKYPRIVIREENRAYDDQTYVLNLAIDGDFKEVMFFNGKLTAQGTIPENLPPLWKTKREGELVYHLFPEGFVMDEPNIIAKVTTKMNNTYIVQRKYKVAYTLR